GWIWAPHQAAGAAAFAGNNGCKQPVYISTRCVSATRSALNLQFQRETFCKCVLVGSRGGYSRRTARLVCVGLRNAPLSDQFSHATPQPALCKGASKSILGRCSRSFAGIT